MSPDRAVPTLVVENLKTHFFTKAGVVKAVDGVDFTVNAGEIMGLVGESGSGKSMTGYSIIGLIDHPGRIVEGRVLLKGKDLRPYTPQQLRSIRGNRIAMIFQDPMMTLNPVMRIDAQMIEAITAHAPVSKQAARERAREALAKVGIPSPDERLVAYPHQFSGGMRQRVAIATALLNKPDLIICDEPTTALDVTIQGQILYEMQKLCRESGTALIWITHDLSVVAGLADTVSVMYAGRIVESGPVAAVLESPRHPYTAGLIASTPAAATRLGRPRGQPLAQIPGMTPSLLRLPSGCAFRTRCSRATDICQTDPPFERGAGGTSLRCFHPITTSLAAEAAVQ
ncbi:MAG: ABC transporter ATP-binding protein [Lautropia sp.]